MNRFRSAMRMRVSGRVPRRWMSSALLAMSTMGMILAPALAHADVINVANSSQLNAALAAVNPGDEIVLANGDYSGFTMTRSGTASAPILIRAATISGARITTGIVRYNQTSYVTVRGLNIVTSGASHTIDGTARKVAVWFEAAQNCRLTRSRLALSGHTGSTEWVMLSGNSQFNRIDHNEFGPNNVDGHLIWPRGNSTIPGVTPPADRTPWANGNGPVNPNVARNTLIDHNYFHDHLPNVTNGGELIVLGGFGTTGDYQDSFSTIEFNLFEDSFGDGELVSVKTSSSTIRYNTIRRCGGGPVSRAGNKSHIYGNFMLQEERTGSSGIRIHEMDHLVFNNYIERAEGSAIIIGDGDPYDQAGFSHAQVKRAKIFHNTFVNNDEWDIGNAHPLDPLELVVANNIFLNTGFGGPSPMAGWTYASNITWPSGPGVTGFTVVNPLLTPQNGLQKLSAGSPAIDAASAGQFVFLAEDMDGQARGTRDIGADEFSGSTVVRRPLTTADVGPNSPEGTVTTAYEAERVNRAASGAGSSLVSDGAAAATFWVNFAADGVSDFIDYILPNVPAGTYELRLRYRSANNRGTLQVRVDGAIVGATLDQYAVTGQFLVQSFGTVTFSQHGSHVVRLTVTGQNPASTGFTLSADAIVLAATSGVGQVAAPVFTPVGGTYATAQSVTITSDTPGASIRYTTDGSAPTPSTGTPFTTPIAVSTTTTLRAIAFASGLTDSAVTTEVYTINSTPGTFFFEGETLTVGTSGEASNVIADAGASGGNWRTFLADGVGDFIDYMLPGVPAGTYTLQSLYKAHPNRGILNLAVNGASVPGTLDQYSADPIFLEASFGAVTFSTSGNQTVRLTVTGRNAAAGTFTLAVDAIRLVPSSGSTLTFEADALARTVSGATAALQNDVNTTGGTWLALQADGAGDFIEYTVPGVPAGAYSVRMSYKGHPNRGTLQLSVDGVNVGGTLEQYSATTIYPTATFGTVTFGAAGTHTIRLTVTGRNAAAGAFTLSSDVFTLVPQ